MEVKKKKLAAGYKLVIFNPNEPKQEIARAYLYILHNELHQHPFGLMEDVFVSEEFRGKGLGTLIINKLIQTAKENNCYKLIGTSRFSRERVHQWYLNFGFHEHGKEFRIDF